MYECPYCYYVIPDMGELIGEHYQLGQCNGEKYRQDVLEDLREWRARAA